MINAMGVENVITHRKHLARLSVLEILQANHALRSLRSLVPVRRRKQIQLPQPLRSPIVHVTHERVVVDHDAPEHRRLAGHVAWPRILLEPLGEVGEDVVEQHEADRHRQTQNRRR